MQVGGGDRPCGIWQATAGRFHTPLPRQCAKSLQPSTAHAGSLRQFWDLVTPGISLISTCKGQSRLVADFGSSRFHSEHYRGPFYPRMNPKINSGMLCCRAWRPGLWAVCVVSISLHIHAGFTATSFDGCSLPAGRSLLNLPSCSSVATCTEVCLVDYVYVCSRS